jgi:hypothetical protein
MSFSSKLDANIQDVFTKSSHCFALFEGRVNLLGFLHKLAVDNSISAMIIGGAALPRYNYNRATEDIDLVLSVSDAQKFGDILYKSSDFIFTGHSKFKHKTGIDVNFCPTGIQAGHNRFPETESKDLGLQYVSLHLLLALKVQAKRLKDKGDFAELVKRNKLSKEYVEKEVCPLLNKMDKQWAILLWEQAQKEI